MCSLRTCNGRVFFLHRRDVSRCMTLLPAEAQAVTRAQSAGVRILLDSPDLSGAPWPAHSSHSSGLSAPGPLPEGLSAPFYLPRNEQGLSMPAFDYVPPVQAPAAHKSDFGNWDFFSAEDRTRHVQTASITH